MYTANDIKERIKEIKHVNAERQRTIVEEAAKKMYIDGLTSVEFTLQEDRLEYEMRCVIENAGFNCEYVGEGVFRMYIPEEE